MEFKPSPLGQFQPNMAQRILSERDSILLSLIPFACHLHVLNQEEIGFLHQRVIQLLNFKICDVSLVSTKHSKILNYVIVKTVY